MDIIGWNVRVYPTSTSSNFHHKSNILFFSSFSSYPFHLPVYTYNMTKYNCSTTVTHAKKKIQPSIIQQITLDDDDDNEFVEDLEDDDDDDDDLLISNDFHDEEYLDGVDDEDYFEDEYATENAQVYAGDGAEGGGVSLAGTWWDKEALTIAENVADSFDGELGLYAFRTLANARIQIRVERLSTKSGSPSMSDIEAFSSAYRTRLDEAESAKTIPENIHLEVSSPGVERVIRIPQDLDRFKERPMYVKYLTEASGSSSENDGIFRLVSFDLETECCTWGLADVRINREKAGKGRPMSKKMREWRVSTPFDSIILARLHSEM